MGAVALLRNSKTDRPRPVLLATEEGGLATLSGIAIANSHGGWGIDKGEQ